jgi:hypothetical protein
MGPPARAPERLRWTVPAPVAQGIRDALARFDADSKAMDLKVCLLCHAVFVSVSAYALSRSLCITPRQSTTRC